MSDEDEETPMITEACENDASKPGRPKVPTDRFSRSKDLHCEVERNRRQKLSAYIEELNELLPACRNLHRKPDKLTVLKMAVNHLKSFNEAEPDSSEERYKLGFLTSTELKNLTFEAADGFMFVVNCTSGRIEYVAEQVAMVLNYPPNEWSASTIFDRLHPNDIEKFREQLSVEGPKSTNTVNLSTGAIKRSNESLTSQIRTENMRRFICRMKMRCGEPAPMGVNHLNRLKLRLSAIDNETQYAVVHCSGYITKKRSTRSCDEEKCFIAIARLQVTSKYISDELVNTSEFLTRLSVNGAFIFVDQRVTKILGYYPQELLGKCCVNFVHVSEQGHIQESLKQVLALKGQPMSIVTKLLNKSNDFVLLRLRALAFMNPYETENIEYIVCTFSLMNAQQVVHPPNVPFQKNQSNDPMLNNRRRRETWKMNGNQNNNTIATTPAPVPNCMQQTTTSQDSIGNSPSQLVTSVVSTTMQSGAVYCVNKQPEYTTTKWDNLASELNLYSNNTLETTPPVQDVLASSNSNSTHSVNDLPSEELLDAFNATPNTSHDFYIKNQEYNDYPLLKNMLSLPQNEGNLMDLYSPYNRYMPQQHPTHSERNQGYDATADNLLLLGSSPNYWMPEIKQDASRIPDLKDSLRNAPLSANDHVGPEDHVSNYVNL